MATRTSWQLDSPVPVARLALAVARLPGNLSGLPHPIRIIRMSTMEPVDIQTGAHSRASWARESRDLVQQVRDATRALPAVAIQARRMPPAARLALGYALALGMLLLLAQLSLLASRMPLRIELDGTSAQFQLDGSSLALPLPAQPTALQLVRPADTVREFQIDGTDSANNFTEN